MPLNLLHIIQRYPPAWGGSEAYFARLSNWLAGRGHSITVWTTDAKDLSAFWDRDASRFEAGIEEMAGVTVHRFAIDHWPLRRYILKALSLLPIAQWKAWTLPVNPISHAMLREAKSTEQKFDAVHASAFPYLFPCLCGLKLARRLDVPFILTPFVHIGPWNDRHNRIRRAYLAKPMVWLLKQADLIFAQSPSEKQAMVDAGVKEERIVLQGLGVDIAEVTGGDRQRVRAAWGVEPTDFVVGHLANQSFEKGTIHLMIASQSPRLRHSRMRLVLAGPRMPSLEVQVRTLMSDPLAKPIVQLGPISEADKKDFFAGIDLFCLPSISDSFGLVLLEAMANGKPCLAFRAGGIGDVLAGGGGWLLGYESPRQNGALARQIESIMANEVTKAMGENGRQRCEAEFAWQPRLEIVERSIERLPKR